MSRDRGQPRPDGPVSPQAPLAGPAAPDAAFHRLPAHALPQVAAYFQVLAEPMRLQLLNLLRGGGSSVGELAVQLGSSAANTSRHLALMAQHGLVAREARGNSVYYALSDPSIDALCDLVCGRIAARLQQQAAEAEAFKGGPV